jgi:hypothetical protein
MGMDTENGNNQTLRHNTVQGEYNCVDLMFKSFPPISRPTISQYSRPVLVTVTTKLTRKELLFRV